MKSKSFEQFAVHSVSESISNILLGIHCTYFFLDHIKSTSYWVFAVYFFPKSYQINILLDIRCTFFFLNHIKSTSYWVFAVRQVEFASLALELDDFHGNESRGYPIEEKKTRKRKRKAVEEESEGKMDSRDDDDHYPLDNRQLIFQAFFSGSGDGETGMQ